MRYDDFRAAVYQIRDNRKEIKGSLMRLRLTNRDKFDDLIQVIDYSRDRVSSSAGDYTDAVIDAIEKFNRDKERIAQHIKELPVIDDAIEQALWAVSGVRGALLIDYFIMGHAMRDIEAAYAYSQPQIYRLIRAGIEDAYEIHEGMQSTKEQRTVHAV